MKPILLRLCRAGVLALVGWLIHAQHGWIKSRSENLLAVGQVRDFFPGAVSLGPRDPHSGAQRVLDATGETLGLVMQTAPLSNRIIGYSGPTNTLIACDPQGRVIGLRVRHSDDTVEHLQEVIQDRAFFDAFLGLRLGDPDSRPKVHAVSGATLTSGAIAEGVLRRLGQEGPSLRFPDEINLAEVRELVGAAASLRPAPSHRGVFEVLDGARQVVALACRTSPAADSIVGYKGPSDSLLILNPEGSRLVSFRLRRSYDTRDYVGYVTGDRFFARAFEGMSLDQLAALDFQAAKIEGVSGATETSWAVAEGLKRRAQSLRAPDRQAGGWPGARWNADNIGLCLMMAWSCAMAFTPLRGRRWIRIAHETVLVVYVGFFLGAMLSQELLAGWARHGLPWAGAPALVLLAAAAFLLPLTTRRQFYCHHFCPHGALQQLVARRAGWNLAVPPRLSRRLQWLPPLLLGVVLVAVMLGWKLNLSALEPFDAYLFRIAGWASIAIATAGLVASLFIPMAYCRYGCPTGALLKFVRYTGHADQFGSRDALALAFAATAAILHWKREALTAWLG